MARMGRPKLENPRSEGVFIRLTKDEHTDITEYASSHDLTITPLAGLLRITLSLTAI